MALIVVPARLKSTRLPQKLIQKIGGKEVILHLCDHIKALRQNHDIVVTTDSTFIQHLIQDYCDFDVLYSTKGYNNGTERIADVADSFTNEDIVVNIQADEYDVMAVDIEHLISSMKESDEIKISTLVGPLEEIQQSDASVVKAILDERNEAIDFVREMTSAATLHYGHHGIYAYRSKTLRAISKLPKTNKEIKRSLEQMRWLESGYKIHCVHSDRSVSSLNTLEDLQRIRNSLNIK